jgi:hypothetical protein
MVEWFNDRSPHHLEPAAQIIPDSDTQFVAGLGEAQKSIAAIPADLTPVRQTRIYRKSSEVSENHAGG